jgi:hypothetical protein
MNPQEPVVPDPDGPAQDPAGPVSDPANPDQPSEYQAARSDDPNDARDNPEDYQGYDEAVAESFPASDPPAASEPGAG